MEPFRYHVFVCDQRKPEGAPACTARGSAEVIEVLRREVVRNGLVDAVQITSCGSLGLCEKGPNMVVYPDGVWYSGVTSSDVTEIVQSHFLNDTVVERLARTDASELRAEIILNRARMHAALKRRNQAGMLPDDLMQTIRCYQESRAILTAVELDLFSAVGAGAAAAEAAVRAAADPRATEMLLNALAAIGLLSKKGERFENTSVSARFLVSGAPDDWRHALMHTVNQWDRWSTLTECVRKGSAVLSREELPTRGDWTESFIAAMDRNAAERAPLVVQAVGTTSVRRMLDVGGGSAAYSIAFARAEVGLHADMIDLEAVLPIARRHIEAANLQDRIRLRAGDLRRDNLGSDYDLVLVSAICHMLGPQENLDLIHRCYTALAVGGRLVIQDFILDASKAAPKSGALFALNMLVGTEHGSSYSEDEYGAWMRETGFSEIRHHRIPGPSGLMVGSRR